MPGSETLRADPLLEGLDATQREAVTADASPLAILAGAGSGKTRVLTRRIAWQASRAQIDPDHVLALTFTRKAAGELVSRLGRLGVRRQVTAGTFHAIALAQLRRRCTDRDRTMPGILSRKARILAPMMPGRGAAATVAAAEVASEIEWAKARLVRPDGYEAAVARARRDPPRPAAEIASLYERYERERRKRGVVDFDDLIWWCADALETDPEFQATQRWRFRHLFVDEFQDVNPAQLRLLRGWLGDRSDLCAVGDADQAIYGFAGADPDYLTDFARHFPGATVVRLGSNYRSSPQVVAAAAGLLADGGARRPPVRTSKPDGPAPTFVDYDDDEAEAIGVVRGLRREHGPQRPWSAMAVLYRTNAQSARFEEALGRDGIPFRVRGASRFLERPEVRAALEGLTRTDKTAPGRPFSGHLADLTAEAAAASEEQREHVDALVRLGREYLAADGGPGSVDGFRAYLDVALRASADDGAGRDAVELLTFHRAKGLEFDVVFVTGLEKGLVPISHADTPAERAEERRLLYVALTRAERALNLSWARRRALGARTVDRRPSPWVEVIEDACSPEGKAPDSVELRRERVARAREKARAAAAPSRPTLAPPDADLFNALVEWRRNLARASGVPAFVIFHDSTLAAVAGKRPRTRKELLAVPGIGKVKVERHGEALLELVGRHTA
ncbi:MAG TPA: ATP-dependent DNA helicase UvrD2 [Acidimicrobiia bacterium]|nr:ATP-dependent DNA helicase UvrD2 [Acidimicrobiia bacterium]